MMNPRSERYGDPGPDPECHACGQLEYNLIYCPKCNASFCEACAVGHCHACEDCGGTGTDPGSLYEPEVCKECGGSKLGDNLYALSVRRTLAARKVM